MKGLQKEGDAFTRCIGFLSDFHSPRDKAASSVLGEETDQEYQGFQW